MQTWEQIQRLVDEHDLQQDVYIQPFGSGGNNVLFYKRTETLRLGTISR